MQERIDNALANLTGEPAGTMKGTGWLVLALVGVFLALAAVFSISIPLILLPFVAAGVLLLFFFRPTWGIITAILLLTIKRLFAFVVGTIPFFTVNRALVFWVLLCLLLHRFVLKTWGPFHRHDQNRVALLFCIWFSLCALLALDKTYAMHMYPQFIGNFLLFFLIYQLIDNRKQLGFMFLSYIALLAASGMISMIGARLTTSKLFTTGRYYGSGLEATQTFRAGGMNGMEPNNYAVVVVLCIFTLAIMLWWKDLRPWHRGLIIFFIFLFLFLLSQTLSRTGMILFILATIVYLIRYRKRIGWRRIAIGGAVLLLVLSVLATERVVDRFSSISEVKGLNLSEDRSISNRIGLTLMLPKLVAMNPIFGVGPGNIPYLTSKTESRGYVARNLRGVGYRAHNQYVELIGETGIIGFLIFALLMGLCIRDLLISRRLLRDKEGTFLWSLTEAMTLIIPLYFLGAATLEAAGKPTFWIILSVPIITRRILEREADSAAQGPPSEAPLPSPTPALD